MKTFIIPFAALLMNASLALANDYDNLMRAHKYAEAEKLADQKLSTSPHDPEALAAKTSLLLSYQKEERTEEALKVAELCVEKNPKHAQCHEVLGNVLGSKAMTSNMFKAMTYVGKFKDSIHKSIELDPQKLSSRNSLLQFYLNAPSIAGGGVAKAQAFIEETKEFNSNMGQLLLAAFHLSQKQESEAEQIAFAFKPDQSLDQKYYHAYLLNGIASAYFMKKNWDQASKIYSEIQSKYPQHHFGFLGIGRVLFEQGKVKEALPYLEKSYALESIPVTQFRLAQCLNALGEKSRSLSLLEKSLSARPYLSKKTRKEAEDLLKQVKS